MSYIGKLFAHLHPSTKGLDSEILNKTTELIYCCRGGVESVTLVTDNIKNIKIFSWRFACRNIQYRKICSRSKYYWKQTSLEYI